LSEKKFVAISSSSRSYCTLTCEPLKKTMPPLKEEPNDRVIRWLDADDDDDVLADAAETATAAMLDEEWKLRSIFGGLGSDEGGALIDLTLPPLMTMPFFEEP
jgi:hypothetical protein